MANFIRSFTCIRSPSSQTRTRPETRVWWLSKPETRFWQKGHGFGIPDKRGNRGSRGASAPPTKLLRDQVIHPATQFFSVLFANILGDVTYTGNLGDRGEHGGEKWVTIQVVRHLSVVITYLCSCLTVTSLTELNIECLFWILFFTNFCSPNRHNRQIVPAPMIVWQVWSALINCGWHNQRRVWQHSATFKGVTLHNGTKCDALIRREQFLGAYPTI